MSVSTPTDPGPAAPDPAAWKPRFRAVARLVPPPSELLERLGITDFDLQDACEQDPALDALVQTYRRALDRKLQAQVVQAALDGDAKAQSLYFGKVRPASLAPSAEPIASPRSKQAVARGRQAAAPPPMEDEEPIDPEVAAAMIQAGLDAYDALQARKAAAERSADGPPLLGAILPEVDPRLDPGPSGRRHTFADLPPFLRTLRDPVRPPRRPRPGDRGAPLPSRPIGPPPSARSD